MTDSNSQIEKIIKSIDLISLDEALIIAGDPDIARPHRAALLADMAMVAGSLPMGVAMRVCPQGHWFIGIVDDDGSVAPWLSGATLEGMADQITRQALIVKKNLA